MDFVALVQDCAPWVAHQTMAAIVKTESGFKPLAIGVNGGARLARQPESKQEAVITANWLIANGYSIDLGLGQVNSSNLVRTGLTVEDAFDPCKNISAAAHILHGNFKVARTKVQGDQAALLAALSAYNTGSYSRGFENGYVRRVVNNANTALPSSVSYLGTSTPIPLVNAKAQATQRITLNATTTSRMNPKPKEGQPLPTALSQGQRQGEEVLDVFSRADTLVKNQ